MNKLPGKNEPFLELVAKLYIFIQSNHLRKEWWIVHQ